MSIYAYRYLSILWQGEKLTIVCNKLDLIVLRKIHIYLSESQSALITWARKKVIDNLICSWFVHFKFICLSFAVPRFYLKHLHNNNIPFFLYNSQCVCNSIAKENICFTGGATAGRRLSDYVL